VRVTGTRRRAAAVAASAVVVALVAGCGDLPEPLTTGPEGAAPADGLARIVDLAAVRAVLSDRVAAAKAGTGQPVTDPAREKVVVDDARADATRAGIDPEWTARVFADQIAASTQVQNDLLRRWNEQPGTRPAPADLAQVRPELDRIGDELVAALQVATPARANEDCASSLAQAAVTRSATLDDVHRAALGRALTSVCDGTTE
jgi:chorismate mutase